MTYLILRQGIPLEVGCGLPFLELGDLRDENSCIRPLGGFPRQTSEVRGQPEATKVGFPLRMCMHV